VHRIRRNPVGHELELNSIRLTDAKELRLKQPGECHSERRAHDEARQCESESLVENKTVDASLLRAERHADADFSRALASAVSHDAIDADGGEQHSKKTERAGKRSRDASKKYAELHGDGKRIHIEQRQFPIELASSTGRRNSCVKFTRRSLEAQSFSRALI
jgi:hypothetical protein